MKSRFTTWALLVAFTASMLALPASTVEAQGQNSPAQNSLLVPVTGTVANIADATVNGTFAIQRFALQDGNLVAIGTLTATVTDALGNVIRTIISQIVMDVLNPQGTCEILFLQLGPLELDLLGLQIFLDQITLEIVAEAGAGNLLGNLLCAIAGLLDPLTLGNRLVNLLNQLIGVLS
jgi:hypothetical protein